MTKQQNVLQPFCKKCGDNPDACDFTCYPRTLMHGMDGNGGIWRSTQVPKRYRSSFLSTLPIKDQNPEAYAFVKRYIDKVTSVVENGIGLYLYSVPNKENRKGTGTGKTTVATAILNEFVIRRVIEHTKGERSIEDNPALFVKASELQNTFNSQFRGTDESREQAASKFNKYKKLMLTVELLVIDDIALRGTTEAYQDVFYEIIDKRYNEELATIFTSNTSLKNLAGVLNQQIASRVEGMTEDIAFEGADNRKGGIL
ncbi:ATP-binding protein [Bacillus haynesii]|uniref:ATP-binding protein n=1 Tax=Bacillus haynesii TaxID=1925021 RepID=UPI0022800051|nr:ATP-binding protein [Bacillus haynesii]MCY8048435.1 ATP-binding protein [Bacillus haynesii]MCY8668773.1 ATP-binding protein [Bacillus haynesii]MCY9324089.1 ATP-binding protein [Bacillus haynesii]